MEQPATNLSPITALHKANCIAALVILSEYTYVETPKQKRRRERLIAEIIATNDVLMEGEKKLPNPTVEQAIAIKWKDLWEKTERELKARGVKL